MNYVKKLSIIFAIVAIILTSSCSSAKKENLRLLEKGYNYESSLSLNIELNDFSFKGEYDEKKIKDSDSLVGLLNTHKLAMKYKTILNDNNTITRKYYDCTFENASYEGDNIKYEIERPWWWNYNGSISKDDIKKITDDFLLYPISAFNRFDNGTYILTQNTKMGNKVSFDVEREDVDGQSKVVHSITRIFEREFGVRHSIISAAKKRKAGEVWVLEASELKDLLDSGLTNLKLEGSLILQAKRSLANNTIFKILDEFEINGRLKDSDLRISWLDTKGNELSVEISAANLRNGDFDVEIHIDTEKEIVALATLKIDNLEYKVNIKEISGTSADIEATGNVSLNLQYKQTKEKIKE